MRRCGRRDSRGLSRRQHAPARFDGTVDGMRSTIDKAGRLVVPRSLRDELGLPEGGAVDVTFREGHVEIEPVPEDVRLVERDGFLAAETSGETELLTTQQVRDSLERGRR